MSPQIIPHFSATSSGGLTWDANMIAKNPYVIGLEGCIFRRVVDTIADLANISNLQLNDRALVWGADSTETKIFQWDGTTWGDMGQPLSNVQYIDAYSKESMFFYKVEPNTVYFGDTYSGISVLTLLPNCYVLGKVKAYKSGSSSYARVWFTQSTTSSFSMTGLTNSPTDYIIPIKTNGIFIRPVLSESSVYIGFKMVSN